LLGKLLYFSRDEINRALYFAYYGRAKQTSGVINSKQIK